MNVLNKINVALISKYLMDKYLMDNVRVFKDILTGPWNAKNVQLVQLLIFIEIHAFAKTV